MRRWLAGVLVALFALAGCQLRTETPTPSPLVPDAAELARDDAAAHADALVVLAGQVLRSLPADDPSRTVVTEILQGSFAHLEALGGVYESGMPPALAAPKPSVTGYSGTSVASLYGALVAEHQAILDAAVLTDSPELLSLFASMALFRMLQADRLAAVSGLDEPPLVTTAWVDVNPALKDPSTLVSAIDSVGFGLEVVAARTSDDLRARALDVANQMRDLASSLAAVTGVAGTPADTRLAAYPVPDVDLADPAVVLPQVGQWFADLAADAKAQLPDGPRAWLLSVAAWATQRSLEWTGGAIPVLP